MSGYTFSPSNLKPVLDNIFDALVEAIAETTVTLANALRDKKEIIVEETNKQLSEQEMSITSDQDQESLKHYLTSRVLIEGLCAIYPDKRDMFQNSASLLFEPSTNLPTSELIKTCQDKLLNLLDQPCPTRPRQQRETLQNSLKDTEKLEASILGHRSELDILHQVNQFMLTAAIETGYLPASFSDDDQTEESKIEASNQAMHGGASTTKTGAQRNESSARSAVVQGAQQGPQYVKSTTRSFFGEEQHKNIEKAGQGPPDSAGFTTMNIIETACQGVDLTALYKPDHSTPLHHTPPGG